MNYKKRAEEILNNVIIGRVWEDKDLVVAIETALREAAGEKVEPKLESGDHVLVSDGSDEPTIKAIYLELDEEGSSYAYRAICGTFYYDNCIPDPEFARPLYFKPIVEGQKFKIGKYYFLYSDGHISKSLSDYTNGWVDAIRYAVIPEGWGE